MNQKDIELALLSNAAAIEAAKKSGVRYEVAKAAEACVTVGMDLQGYSLSKSAPLLYGIDCPLWSSIPKRVLPDGGDGEKKATTTHVKRVKNIIVPDGVVAFGERGEPILRETEELTFTHATIGVEDVINDEVASFGRAFKVSPMMDKSSLMASLQIAERRLIGSVRTDIGAPTGTPATSKTTGGSLATATYSWKIASVTFDRYNHYVEEPLVYYGGAAGKTGESALSTKTGDVSATSGDKVTITWNDVKAAAAYFIYQKKDGGNWVFEGMAHTNTFTSTADATTSSQNLGTDETGNANAWSGLLEQFAGDSLVKYETLDSAAAWTPDGRGGVKEITEMLKEIYLLKRSKASPKFFYTETAVLDTLADVVLGNIPTGVLTQLPGFVGADGSVVAGIPMKSIRHPLTNQIIPIIPHVDMPPGVLMGVTWESPFADEDNPNAVEVDLSEDWHREVFARAKRKTETGVFLTGTPTVRIGVGNMFIKNCPRSA